MTTTVTIEPLLLPFGLNDLKDWLQDPPEQDDRLLERLLAKTIGEVEGALGRVDLSERTRTLWLDSSGAKSSILLSHQPVIAIDSVTTYDEDDAATVVATTNYRLSDRAVGRLVAVSSGWTLDRAVDAMKIIYRSGIQLQPVANALGTTTTTFVATKDHFDAARDTGRTFTRSGIDTTIVSVTSATTVELAVAQTWAAGDVFRVGTLPVEVELEIERRVTLHYKHRGDRVIGHNVAMDPGLLTLGDRLQKDRWGYYA